MTDAVDPTAEPDHAAEGTEIRLAARRIRADTLLGGTKELIIEHGVSEYRLRLTSKGKLILTK